MVLTTVVASVPYSITFASRSKKNYDLTEAQICSFVRMSNFLVFLSLMLF